MTILVIYLPELEITWGNITLRTRDKPGLTWLRTNLAGRGEDNYSLRLFSLVQVGHKTNDF